MRLLCFFDIELENGQSGVDGSSTESIKEDLILGFELLVFKSLPKFLRSQMGKLELHRLVTLKLCRKSFKIKWLRAET